ncbi:MAG: trimethylamine methyltransferase family protein [Candidatus Bathyarchaeota archaeon]
MVGFEKPSKMPSFRVLSKDDLDAIHCATLDILEKTGIKIVNGEKVLKLLEKKGCTVDFKKETVFFSSSVVEESLKKALKVVTVYSPRNPKYDYKMDGRHIYFSTGGLCVNTADLETGEWRSSTTDDVARIVRVTDALDSFASAGSLTASFDKPEYIRSFYDTVTRLNNTEKPTSIRIGTGDVGSPKLYWELFDYQLEVAKVIAGGEEALMKRPLLSGGFLAMSPLQFHGLHVERALKLAELGFQCSSDTMAQAGATAPVTLAGMLVVTNAEILGGLSIIHIASPSTELTASYGPAAFDMKYGQWAAGAPEESLLNAASVEIAKYYGLTVDVMGVTTSAKTPGPQACYEAMMSGILPILAGADVVWGAGGLACLMTASLEELVIEDELIRAMLTSLHGMKISDETLALDVIKKVGPGGHYLAQKHTMNHFMKEQFIPELIDRSSYDEWKKNGEKSLVDRAKEKVKRILKEHSVPPLDKGIQKELYGIIKRAEKELPKKFPNLSV